MENMDNFLTDMGNKQNLFTARLCTNMKYSLVSKLSKKYAPITITNVLISILANCCNR